MAFAQVKEIDILRSMQYMLEAGMSMHDIMYELSGSIHNKKLAQKLEIADDLMSHQGYKFTDALESVGLFEDFVPIIRTGEKTGNLGRVISEIITTAEKINSLEEESQVHDYLSGRPYVYFNWPWFWHIAPPGQGPYRASRKGY